MFRTTIMLGAILLFKFVCPLSKKPRNDENKMRMIFFFMFDNVSPFLVIAQSIFITTQVNQP